MSKFVLLILKNLGRNKLRTVLTGMAVVVLVAIATAVSSVTRSVRTTINAQAGQSKLFVSERWVTPSRLPIRYVPELTERRGVLDWTVWHYYGGFFDESMRSDRGALGIATRPENLTEMHEGLAEIEPRALEALNNEMTGALVGRSILDQMNWKVGDQFTFISTTHPGRNLRLKIVGVVPHGLWSRTFFFREDYFQEGTGDKSTVNVVILRTEGAEPAESIAGDIRREFAWRQPELKVETESAGIARFAARSQAILAVIDGVVLVLMIDMIVVLSNSISIATRERRAEMAILKVFGFLPLQIFLLVVGEAMLIGALSGTAGAAVSWAISDLAAKGAFPANELTALLLSFPVQPQMIAWGALLGAFVGLIGSAVPAWNARSIKITEVFSKIA